MSMNLWPDEWNCDWEGQVGEQSTSQTRDTVQPQFAANRLSQPLPQTSQSQSTVPEPVALFCTPISPDVVVIWAAGGR